MRVVVQPGRLQLAAHQQGMMTAWAPSCQTWEASYMLTNQMHAGMAPFIKCYRHVTVTLYAEHLSQSVMPAMTVITLGVGHLRHVGWLPVHCHLHGARAVQC